MPQILKDSIKERIDRSALRLFSRSGFADATIARIAREAGISTGNVYNYYKNKERLFYALVPKSFVEQFLQLLRSKYKATDGRSLDNIMSYGPMVLRDRQMRNLLVENRERIIILLDKSEGTRYESFRGDLVKFMVQNVREYATSMEGRGRVAMDGMKYRLLSVIYDNLLQAFVEILKEYETEAEIGESYECLLSYHYGGVSRFLEQGST